jgi:RES domain-containing protein
VAKFPESPGADALREIVPRIRILAAQTLLTRIYFAGGPHPSRWNHFRSIGPSGARWDHHSPTPSAVPVEQSRAVYYCALDIDTCAAEVFQRTRRIDRTRVAPALVVLALREAITLLDLRGIFATAIGASMAIHSGPRSRARTWARDLYEAYPDIQGLYYGSSMNGHSPAIVLNERARQAIPEQPQIHRALNDDLLVEILQKIAVRLSYGLR